MAKESTIGTIVLLIGTVIVSSLFAVVKTLDEVNSIIRASWRLQTTLLALAAPCSLAVYFQSVGHRKAKHEHIEKSYMRPSIRPPNDTAWSGCGYAMYNIGLCLSVANTSILRAAILTQCSPLIMIMFQCMRAYSPWQENSARSTELHWKHIIGVLLAGLGTTMYATCSMEEKNETTTAKPESHLIGDLWGLFASAGYAIYVSFGKRARRKVPTFVHLPGCVFVAMLIVSGVVIAFPLSDDNEDGTIAEISMPGQHGTFCRGLFGWACPEYLPRMWYIGMVCGAIAVSMINWSLSRVQALEVAAATSFEPVAATLISVVLFGEPIPNYKAIFASGIIIYAMLLCSTKEEKPIKRVKAKKLNDTFAIPVASNSVHTV